MRYLKLLFASIAFSFAFVIPTHAEEAFVIDNFVTEIQINEDSSLDITETIDVTFSEERRGIFRNIHDEDIQIGILSVTDEKGNPWEYAEEYEYLTTRIRIGDPDVYLTGKQVYKIQYKVYGAILFFDNHNELYWNSTGTEWPTTIAKSQTFVTLPPGVTTDDPNVISRCLTGYYLEDGEDCTIWENGDSIVFQTNRDLDIYEGVTVVAGFPLGHITAPATLTIDTDPTDVNVFLNDSRKRECNFGCTLENLPPGAYSIETKKLGYDPLVETITLASGQEATLSITLGKLLWFKILVLMLEIIFFAVMLHPIYRWYKYGRDPKGRTTIIPEYEAPDDMSPAEMGTLVDENAEIRDISATIIDLAVRGFIKIKVHKNKKLFGDDDYEFIKKAKPRAGQKASPFEQKMLSYIFPKSTKSKMLSDLKYKFFSKLPKLENDLYQAMIDKKYFKKSPKKVRESSLGVAILTVFSAIILVPLELIFFGSAWTMAVFFNGIVALFFHRAMPRKTKTGMLAYQGILGYEDYLTVAEKHRIKFEEKENYFFQHLPYAMTLGVAEKWSKAFKHLYDAPPDWIEGLEDGKFDALQFVNSMNGMSSSIVRTMKSTYTPPATRTGRTSSGSRSFFSGSASSGSSGFSSSSFSGGGFGGGGGGSW